MHGSPGLGTDYCRAEIPPHTLLHPPLHAFTLRSQASCGPTPPALGCGELSPSLPATLTQAGRRLQLQLCHLLSAGSSIPGYKQRRGQRRGRAGAAPWAGPTVQGLPSAQPSLCPACNKEPLLPLLHAGRVPHTAGQRNTGQGFHPCKAKPNPGTVQQSGASYENQFTPAARSLISARCLELHPPAICLHTPPCTAESR